MLLYYTPTTVRICVHINKSFPSPPNNLYMILHLKQMAFPSKPLNLDCCSTLGQGGSWEVPGPQLPSRGNSSESSINLPQSHSRPVTGWACPAPGSAQGDGGGACVYCGRDGKEGLPPRENIFYLIRYMII